MRDPSLRSPKEGAKRENRLGEYTWHHKNLPGRTEQAELLEPQCGRKTEKGELGRFWLRSKVGAGQFHYRNKDMGSEKHKGG